MTSSGTLMVVGTDQPNQIAVTQTADQVFVSRDGETANFNRSDVKRMSIDAMGGDDVLTNGTSLRSTLRGGRWH